MYQYFCMHLFVYFYPSILIQKWELKNEEKTLPIKKSDEVALFGYTQIDTLITGGGSAAINEDTRYRTVRIQQGFTNAGIALNNDVKAFYNSGSGEVLLSSSLIEKAAKSSDIAIYVVRKSSSEWEDRDPNTNEYGYYLTETVLNNISSVSSAFHAQGKKLVVGEMRTWTEECFNKHTCFTICGI